MDLLELLTAGRVDAFNAARGQRRKVELFAEDLAGLKLRGVDLSGATLEKSDLTGTDLSDANLGRTDLSGVDASGARFVGALGVGARFRDAVLDGADFTGADVSHGDFAEAVLTGARADGLRLSGARLRGIDAAGVHWSDVDFAEAKLHKANFAGATLARANLTDASCGDAVFSGATLSGLTAPRLRGTPSQWVGARLDAAVLDEAVLSECDFSGADLRGAQLRRANLTSAKFVGAKLAGAVLADAVLDGADFTDADLTGADFTGIDVGMLGLSDAQRASLGASGVVVATDAPLAFDEVSAARHAGAIALAWKNDDGEGRASLRFAVVGREGRVVSALPVSAEGILTCEVVPFAEGFRVVVVQERASGTSVFVYPLSASGELGAVQAFPLGYEAAVKPLVRVAGAELTLWGLSRRGPALVVQRLGAEGLAVVGTSKQATATAFIGGRDPVLSCKGGVAVPVTDAGAGAPLRTPAGFPGTVAASVAHDERWLLVWDEPARSREEPGGLFAAWTGPGVTPRPEVVASGHRPRSLDLLPAASGARAAWIAPSRSGDAVFAAKIPDGSPDAVDLPDGAVPRRIRFVRNAEGDRRLPVLAVTTMDGGLVIVDLDSEVLAEF